MNNMKLIILKCNFNVCYIGFIFILLFSLPCFGLSKSHSSQEESTVTTAKSVRTSSQNARTFKFETATRTTSTRMSNGREKPPRSKHESEHRDGAIVFPTDDMDSGFPNRIGNEKIPRRPVNAFEECSKGSSTICEKVNNYPKDLLDQILSKEKIGTSFVGANDEILHDISNRIGNIDESLCVSDERVVYPTGAKDKNDVWTFIVNDENKPKYQQGVRVDICRKPGSACQYSDSLPPNINCTCKQKYILRQLIAFDKEDKVIYTDQFKIPSCCASVISHVNIGDSEESRSALVEPLALSINSEENKHY